MDRIIKQYLGQLINLREARGARRKKIIKNADDKFMKIISYIARQLLSKKYILTNSQKQIIQHHKQSIITIADRSIAVKRIKRSLLKPRFPIGAIIRPFIEANYSEETELSQESDSSMTSQDSEISCNDISERKQM